MMRVRTLKLRFRAGTRIEFDGYAGDAWRGALGAALRRSACVTGAQHCSGCRFITSCAYGRLFETPAEHVRAGPLARYPTVPHPYVVLPRHETGRVRAGGHLDVDVKLIGPASELDRAVTSVARRMKVAGGVVELIEASRDELNLDTRRLVEPSRDAEATNTIVAFETPLRVRQNGSYMGPAEFGFRAFFSALMRRVSMFHQYCEGAALAADFGGLAKTASALTVDASGLEWHDWHRYSARQHRRIPMGGVVGQCVIHELPRELLPWLEFGQHLHVGKGTVFGLGAIEVTSTAAGQS